MVAVRQWYEYLDKTRGMRLRLGGINKVKQVPFLDMKSALPSSGRGIRFYGGLAVAVVFGYVATVGVVPAILRHTGDSGRLQWLKDVPGALVVLEGYLLPARELSRIPCFNSAFELFDSIWWRLLDPPDTTA